MKKRMNTKKLVYIGLLAAVATALMYLELPLTFLFMPPFLKLDISGVPTLIGTFMSVSYTHLNQFRFPGWHRCLIVTMRRLTG